MGLDAVELIMSVEETFDIEIPDEEAPKLRTAGQMYRFVMSRLAPSPVPIRCMTSAVFYPTRRALMEISGAARREITPSTSMKSLLPSREREAAWQALGQTVEARLPDLELPAWVRRVQAGLSLTLLVIGLAACFTAPTSLILVYALTSALGIWAAQRALRPLATQVPPACGTVGATVRTIARLKHGIQPPPSKTWTPDEVWERLRGVIAAQFAVPPEAITADTDFVRDLGAD